MTLLATILRLAPGAHRAKSRLAGEHGVLLVEVGVAVMVLAMGMAAMLGSFTSSKRLSLSSQRRAVAVHIAQMELEKTRSYSWAKLVMTGPAQDTGDPRHPVWLGSPYGDLFQAAPNDSTAYTDWESLSFYPPDFNGSVQPLTNNLTVGSVGVDVYRYVTLRRETCGFIANCVDASGSTTVDTKRVTIGVTVDPVNGLGPSKPVWISSIRINPSGGRQASEFCGATC